MHQRTLLLIDDDRIWAKTIARFLREQKYTVIFADTCAAGIRAVLETRPDCVILDFNLPDMDGCEASFAIRKDATVRKTPIIMASNDDSKESEAYQHYQVDGFYYKMWPLPRLGGLIEVTLRRVDLERGNLAIGDLRLDGTRQMVFRDSTPLAELSREQFKMFSLLASKSPEFVPEKDIVAHVFGEGLETDKLDAIKMLAYRLRKSLGPRLARRVKCVRGRGWIYLSPKPSIMAG